MDLYNNRVLSPPETGRERSNKRSNVATNRLTTPFVIPPFHAKNINKEIKIEINDSLYSSGIFIIFMRFDIIPPFHQCEFVASLHSLK